MIKIRNLSEERVMEVTAERWTTCHMDYIIDDDLDLIDL